MAQRNPKYYEGPFFCRGCESEVAGHSVPQHLHEHMEVGLVLRPHPLVPPSAKWTDITERGA